MSTPAEMTPFQAVTHYFDQACDRLGVSDEIRLLMCTPDREVRVEIPVRMDDGALEVFIGYRIQHNNARALTRVACATIQRPTMKRFAPWRR